jgi:endonuclease-3 related protein
MVKKESRVLRVYRILFNEFGPQHWWPAKTPFEVVVGAILTQNTNWGNVEKAIRNLKKDELLIPKKIVESRALSIERRIRPSGYYRQKTRKLKAFVGHLFRKHQGSLKKMFRQKIEPLREELLSIHGIGEETADSIILYAAGKPSFVVDAYTKRIGQRLGWFAFSDYGSVQRYFEEHLPRSVKIYNEYHALLVELAKRCCRKKPLCSKCSLKLICLKKV